MAARLRFPGATSVNHYLLRAIAVVLRCLVLDIDDCFQCSLQAENRQRDFISGEGTAALPIAILITVASLYGCLINSH